MKTPGKLKLLLTVPVILLAATLGIAQESQPFSINNSPLPAPTGFVNDYTGVIDSATKQRLEARLKEFKDRTNPSVEIAVAVIKTTGGRDIFEYSLAVARGWKIGSKADDNPGALLLVAIDDRKYFTQVSRDLEDELPDGRVGNLQRQHLVPEFKKGNYAKGIEDTIEAYIAAIENQGGSDGAPAPGISTTPSEKADPPFPTCCCGIVILVIIFIIIILSDRSGGTRGGGSGSGSGGSSVLPFIVGAMLSGGSGSSGSSSSGSWGGSSDWGGGGGFGGFGGGGDFGGGGAGGDW